MKKFSFSRCVVFSLGFLLMALPAGLILFSLKETEKISDKYRKKEAIEKNQTILTLFRNSELGNLILEDKLRAFSELVSADLSVTQNTHLTSKEVKSLLTNSLPCTESNKIHPKMLAILQYSPFQNDSESLSSYSINFPIIEDFPQKLNPFFKNFLLFVTKHFLGEEDFNLSKSVNESAPNAIGVFETEGYFSENMRGKVVKVEIEKKTYLLYWQFLLSSDLMKSMDKFGPPKGLGPTLPVELPKKLRGKILLGAILVVLPDDREKTQNPKSLVTSFNDENSATALFSNKREFLACNSTISKSEWNKIFSGTTFDQSGNEWLLSNDFVELDDGNCIFTASKIHSQNAETLHQYFLIYIGLGIYLCLVTGFWFFAVFFEIGVTSTLIRQLFCGFSVAALLPLAIAFYISDQVSEERLENLRKQDRLELLQELEDIELGVAFHHEFTWEILRKASKNKAFLNHLEKLANWILSDPSKSRILNNFIQEMFDFFRRSFFRISLRSLAIAGPNKFHFWSSGEENNQDSVFSQLMGGLGEISLKGLNPNDFLMKDTKSTENIGISAKNEMIVSIGAKNLLSVFGPQVYYNLIFGGDSPLFLTLGTGDWVFFPILSPSSQKPRFVLVYFYSQKSSDTYAVFRILSTKTSSHYFFMFDRDRIGFGSFPEKGESFPFLRGIAKQTYIAGDRISSRLDHGGETWQIEGYPGKLSRQFIFVGLSPETPLKSQISRERNRFRVGICLFFFIALLLSFSVSREILAPLRQLQNGLDQIKVGNYEHRICSDRADELGAVLHAFNSMARGLEEKKIMEILVSSSARKALDSQHGEERAKAGIREEVTILFVGIPDFEHFLKEEDPQLLIEKLNKQIGFICRTINEAQGDVDKLLGDKILAFFRHGEKTGSVAAQGAIKVVREILEAQNDGFLPFKIAAGINSGTVISGLLGSGEGRDFTIIGDPVNLAARAEALAESLDGNKVVLTESAMALLGDSIKTKRLNVTSVKGKQKPVELSQLI
ncbi:MAG: adenylate/guanylate cyclase domain-containing protein [Candidatus Riflebacteria bacterium]|nr:adenylate/guanylate cyclase domain-containing protein [Candidatus Riflebacteria bacterium]